MYCYTYTTNNMKSTWHDEKRQTNLLKHDLDFADAHSVFDGFTFTFEDTRFNYGEQRFVTVGLPGDKVVVIVHTETADNIHIISMRKANRHERKLYFKNLF